MYKADSVHNTVCDENDTGMFTSVATESGVVTILCSHANTGTLHHESYTFPHFCSLQCQHLGRNNEQFGVLLRIQDGLVATVLR